MVSIRAFLRDARDAIVAEWKGDTWLADRLPDLLESIGELAEHAASGSSHESTFAMGRHHAVDTSGRDFDVSHVVAELSRLRACIVNVWQRGPWAGRHRELAAVNVAIDAVIAASVSRFQEPALAKLEALLSASPVGIGFLDRDLRYIRINEALASLNRRSPAEHIGKSFAEVLPATSAASVEPMLRRVMETGTPVLNHEIREPIASEGHRTYLATFFPVRMPSGEVGGVGGVVADVTEARRAEADLRRVQEHMQSVLEHTPAPIWIKDSDGRVVLANHRVADALGHRYEDILGRRSEDLLPADVAAAHRAHDAIVMNEGRAIEIEESVPAPGGMRTFLAVKFPLPGEPPFVGAIATEITERKRIEEELRVAVRARERTLAIVSHDLRNPLGTIQVSAALLMSQLASDPRWRRHLEIIHRSCLRMEHLIADLLDMASIGAGRLSIATKPEPADEVLREASDLHQPLAAEKDITLVQRCAAEGVFIECDRQRVMQVFANLIGNALKACRAGDTVTLACDPGDDAIRFSVEDTGPGIEPELLGHLFDPYWSGPGWRTGVGLGLYIARGIVERHGGHIDVESTAGQGTRFWFTVPMGTNGGRSRPSITPPDHAA